MSYVYEQIKPQLYCEDGLVMFTLIRDNAKRLLCKSGAASMLKLMAGSGDSFKMMACVDRMVELGELREILQNDVCGQDRVFVAGPQWNQTA